MCSLTRFATANFGGDWMISAWWLIAAFVIGEAVGVIATAIVSGRGEGYKKGGGWSPALCRIRN